MITIDISGPRGEGKTTTALRIVQLLRDLGFDVEYVTDTALHHKVIEGMLADGTDLFSHALLPRSFQRRDVDPARAHWVRPDEN